MEGVVSYFDDIAHIWDNAIVNHKEKLRHIIALTGMQDGDRVLDVGGGTGTLIPFIREVNNSGIITEVDVSRRMLNMARAKFHNDTRIVFIEENIEIFSEAREYDRIILYNVLPYFADKISSIVSLYRNNLKANGCIVIAHLMGMERLNRSHSHGDLRVSKAILPPVDILVERYRELGLNVVFTEDSADDYTILIK